MPYRVEGTCGRCVCGVAITDGAYTIGCDRGRDPRILPEYAQLGMTVSCMDRPDCSTSSAQEGILVDWGGGCEVDTAVCAVEKIGVAVVPEGCPVGVALVTSLLVLTQLRVSSCHCLCTGKVHLSSKKR